MSDGAQFQIFFSDEFKERLRTLAKRYRHIRFDLQPIREIIANAETLDP